MTRPALWCSLLILACASAYAQAPAAGHAAHQGEFQLRELPPPPMMDGIGDASLKITTNSEAAQAYFNQGLRLLHCFWDFEAYRAFKEAARLDPSAAMAYWGIYKALGFNRSVKDDRLAALSKAKSLMSNVSEHEQFYIRAAELQEKPDEKDRSAHRREMEALVDRYPDDVDARAFLALSVMGGYDADERPREGTLYGQAILRNLLSAHPDNAAANHYWIHAVEGGPRPETALRSAELLARLAPRSGHMVHMPGHIYWRMGDYERARQSFLDSMRVDEAYMESQKIHPEEDWNYAHNISYLIAACAEAGRYQEGLEWAKKLKAMPAPPGMSSSRFVMWAGASVVRLHVRFGDWQAVPSAPIEFGKEAASVSPAAEAYAEGLVLYAKGMAAIEKGDDSDAARQSEGLDALLWRLEASKPETKPGDRAESGMGEDDPSAALRVLAPVSLDLRGNLASARGDHSEAFKLLQQAASKEKDLGYSEPPSYYRPEQESLGYAYLRAREWEDARRAFTQALHQRPKSGHALYGIAQSYALAGDASKAAPAYQEFLASWPHADSDLPQVRQAKTWLAAHGH